MYVITGHSSAKVVQLEMNTTVVLLSPRGEGNKQIFIWLARVNVHGIQSFVINKFFEVILFENYDRIIQHETVKEQMLPAFVDDS